MPTPEQKTAIRALRANHFEELAQLRFQLLDLFKVYLEEIPDGITLTSAQETSLKASMLAKAQQIEVVAAQVEKMIADL